MSRGGSGFPIIIAVLGVLIIGVIGIFIYMQLSKDNGNTDVLASTIPTSEVTAVPTPTVEATYTPEPVVTVPPVTAEPTPDVEATSTPYITAPPITTKTKTVWINVDALKIHPIADWDSETIGKIPYGTAVSGEVSGNYMYTSYDGVTGYIYLKTSASSGRDLVVYSESALVPLDPDPDAPTEDLVSTHSFNESGNTLTLTITFTTAVYGDDNGTGALDEDDFTMSSNGTITDVSHVAGSTTVTVTAFIDTASANYTISIKSQSIFNSSGIACETQSFIQP